MPTLPTLTPYKMDIQQGNVVTQEMVSKLKLGMTRQQVRFVLGTPLVVDPFRTDRWDYVYSYEKGGTMKEQRHISVIFQDDKLLRVEGDVVPAGKNGAAAIDKPRPAAAPAKREFAAPAAPAPKADAAKTPPPEGAKLLTGTGEPVTSGSAGAEAAGGAQQVKEEKAREEKTKEQKPEEERGFFGRILERIGF